MREDCRADSADDVIRLANSTRTGLASYFYAASSVLPAAQTPGVWLALDERLRHRLRAIQLKHWRRGPTIYRELRALGASGDAARQTAAGSRRRWRKSAQFLNSVLTIAYFDRLGVPRLS